jgi:hypothetical protein
MEEWRRRRKVKEMISVEVKLSATPYSSMASGTDAFLKDFGKGAQKGYVIHPGGVVPPLGPGGCGMAFCGIMNTWFP